MKSNVIRVVGVLTLGSIYFLSSVENMSAANYSPVNCSSEPFFAANSCDLCYEEKTPVVVDQRLTGLYDTWIGNNENPPIVYEDEQTLRPTMIDIAGSGTEWGYSAADPASIFQLVPTIPWTTTGATNRKVTTIEKGKVLKFMEQKEGSYIYLKSTNKKEGEYLGMMKFPLIYRYIDPTTGKESDQIPHFECVTYKMGVTETKTGITVIPPTTQSPKEAAPVVTSAPQPAPEKVEVAPTPAPKQITSTKTGPELYFLVVIIALIMPAFIIFRKRRA